MASSTETLLYVGYSLVAAALAVGAGLAAVRTKRSERNAASLLVALVSIATLVAFGLAHIANEPGNGVFELAWVALPALALAAAMTNLAHMSGVGTGARILACPTLCWNLALAWIYGARLCAEVFFVDGGPLASIPLVAASLAQNVVGKSGAEAAPVWVWIPLLLPTRVGVAAPLLTRTVAALTASLLLGVIGLAVGPAVGILRQHAGTSSGSTGAQRGDIETSIRIGDERWLAPRLASMIGGDDSEESIARDLERAIAVGVSEVEFGIRADLVDDAERLGRIEVADARAGRHGRVWRVRGAGLADMAIAMHPKTYVERMRHAHWILAERLQPDLLVLFDRPYSNATRAAVGNLEPKKWREIMVEAAQHLREGKPRQKTAVVLGVPNPRGREIWRALADGRDIHELRFRIEGNDFSGDQAARACLALQGWLAEQPPQVAVTIDANPPTPISFGGPEAVDNYFTRVLELTTTSKAVAKLCIGRIRDEQLGMNGLYTNMGRRRSLVERLPAMLRGAGMTPPKPGR